jgi:polyferredoxin
MIHASDLFLNRIALAVYAIFLIATLIITWLRSWRSKAAATFSRLALSFLVTLLTISISTLVLGTVLFFFLVVLSSGLNPKLGLGSAFFLVVLGPALCGLVAVAISIYPASLVSRIFWPGQPTDEQAVPPVT